MKGKDVLDINAARIAAHRANVNRYRRLLRTQLEPHERAYLLRRLTEEESRLAELCARQNNRRAQLDARSIQSVGHPASSPINREMIMTKNNRQFRDRDSSFDLDEMLHPASAFEHPMEVVRDPDLTLNEKRAILSSWASDACVVDSAPALRQTPRGAVVTFDDVVDALRSLDAEAARAAWNPPPRLVRKLRPRRRRDDSGDSGRSLQ